MTEARPAASRRGRGVMFLFLVLGIAVLSFCREPDAFRRPQLAYEDGRDIFAFYYDHPAPAAVLRDYAGYVSLLPNLIGWLVLQLAPVVWAPTLLSLVPLLLSSLAFAWFFRPAFRDVITSDGLRATACAAAALAPLTNYLFLGNTMYSVWSLLTLLVLDALAPPPTTPLRAVGRGAAAGLLIASHPLSALVAPAWLLRAAVPGAARLARGYFLGLTGLAGLYQLLGVDRSGASLGQLTESLGLTGRFLLERVVFGTLFGDGAARALRRGGHEGWILASALAVTGFLVALALWQRHRFTRRDLAHGGFFLWMIGALTLFYVVSRQPDASILGSDRAFRYFWVQRVLFVFFLFWLGHVVTRGRGAGRDPRLLHSWRAVGASVLGLWLVALNLDNRAPYAVRRGQGEAVRAFVTDLARQEHELGGRQGVAGRLERGVWTIEILPDHQK